MARAFSHDSTAAEIEEFCRNELSMDIFEETALGFALNDHISVIVRPRKSLGMVPSIVLSGTYSDEDVRRFQALKKRFKRPEKRSGAQVSGTRLLLSEMSYIYPPTSYKKESVGEKHSAQLQL